MFKISDLLKQKKILISDGSWGTLLQQRGLKAGECPEWMNITHPEVVFEIAKNYIDAGSDMVETNSFGGNAFKLMHYGLASKVKEINIAASSLSRKAAGDKLVIASMGPTGKILMMGDVSEEEMYNAYREQAMALEEGGADAIIAETMSDIDEARIAVKAAKENTKLEVICTMTFEKTLNGDYRSMMGVSPSEMIDILIQAGASIIGANCGNGSKGMIEIVQEIRKTNTVVPILIHANAGMPLLVDNTTIFPETPEDMAADVENLINAGANIIGGCCGTTPEHIRIMAAKARRIS